MEVDRNFQVRKMKDLQRLTEQVSLAYAGLAAEEADKPF
jgi:hypothetical protein